LWTLCLWNIYLNSLLSIYNAIFHLTFLFGLAMFQTMFLNFIQILLMEWFLWSWITFHYEIDNNLLLILNLMILNCLLFLNLLALLLKDHRHTFLLKAHLRVLLLKVDHLFAFYAFFTLFSCDFLSCYYLVVLELI